MDAAELRDLARAHGLRAPVSFWAAGDSALRLIWNGCGPDSWPAEVRVALGRFYSRYEAAMLVHDYEFATSDGSAHGFEDSQRRLDYNMRLLLVSALKRVAWPWRALVGMCERHKIAAALCALSAFGYPYYVRCATRVAPAGKAGEPNA